MYLSPIEAKRLQHIGILLILAISPIIRADSIPLSPHYNVGDGAYTTESFDGKAAWVPNRYIYFDIPNSFSYTVGEPVYVRIEYHDSGTGTINLQYSSTAKNYQNAEGSARSSRVNTREYVYSYKMLEKASFRNIQNGNSDFRINMSGSDGTPLRIASIQVSTEPFDNEKFQYAISKPWLTPYDGEVHDFVSPHTLKGKILAGYQGWFNAPNDTKDSGWRHWCRNGKANAQNITIDAWPYLDEYKPENLYPADRMTYKQNGEQAYLFSSADAHTVQTHFKWMRKCGIDGVYLQRFVNKLPGQEPEFVVNNVMEACSKEGRVWALEYDISSLTTDQATGFNIIKADWEFLVNKCHILDDPRYLHEEGKPVLFIWGFGVRDHSLSYANQIIDYFAAQGLYLISGTRNWDRDDPDWRAHFKKFDQILAWQNQPNKLQGYRNLADEWGIKYLPHVWPGFSWHNTKNLPYPTSYTAREQGAFYWRKIKDALNLNVDQIFIGMFDEYDEGTHVMPMADHFPEVVQPGEVEGFPSGWGHYIDNEGKDPFLWLRLSGAMGEILNGLRPATSTMPNEADLSPMAYVGDDATCYLGSINTERGMKLVNNPDGDTYAAIEDTLDCRKNGPDPTDTYFYFNIDDSFCYTVSAGQQATIEVEFYDDTAGIPLRLQYDSVGGGYKQHDKVVSLPGLGGWKITRWNISDGYFANRQYGGSDFRIGTGTGNTISIRRVSLFLPEGEEVSPTLPIISLELVKHGVEGSTNPSVKLIRSGNTNATVTVTYEFKGSATTGDDYTASTTHTFNAGDLETFIPIELVDDALPESKETIEVSLLANTTYTINSLGQSVTATITDNDSTTSKPPNIVVLMADDLGYSDISYNPYHGPEVSTPNIDNLIRNGIWFSSAYVCGNICAPSRAGFMIGSYPQRIGVHEERDVNSSGFTSTYPIFPQHLAQSGDSIQDYASIMLGKFHMGRDRNATVSIDGNADGDYTDYEQDYGETDPATLKYHPMKRGFTDCWGFINLGGQSYWTTDDGFYSNYYRYALGEDIDGIDDGEAVETYLTTRLTDKAIDYINEKSEANTPFYVHLAYSAVHTPMHAPPSPTGLNPGDEGWYPDAAYFNANYPNMWQTPSYTYNSMSNQDKQDNRAYLMAMLYHLDNSVGRVMDALEKAGERENTIVIFFSDNGGSQASVAANDPLRERKHFNYEGGVRVPMCIYWPKGLGTYHNSVIDAPIMNIDILPTVLDAAGIEPINGFESFDGKSLLPLIRGETNSAHDALFWSEGSETGEFAVRSENWKLYMDEDVFELYNLNEDIGETINLASTYPNKVRELRSKYFDWIVEMTEACGETPEERMWTYETPIPTIGPGHMAIEEFDYVAGSLASAGGGSGWINAWNGSGDMRVNADSLRFPNAHYNNGGANGCSANDETSVNWFTWNRTFAEPITSGTTWVSFLSAWDPDAGTASPYLGPSDNAWQSFLINGNTANHLTIFGGNGNRWSGAHDDWVLVDNRGSGNTNLLLDAGSVFDGEANEHATFLHIIKMETNISGGNDRITWYVTSNTAGITGNTVADLESAVSEGTLTKMIATSSDGDWWGDSLTGIGIEVNNTPDSQWCDISFDNIRVVYGLSDDASVAALLNGDSGISGSTPKGFKIYKSQLSNNLLSIEHDEKAGWYTGGVVYEATDSLTNATWAPVSPSTKTQIDRYLDNESYRVTFPTDQQKQFFRIRGE